ncbi:MAG: hypothetical protein HYU97_09160 [Deltaproteobacteria bacterium]|nr:hypothetical protein [Deltaproteobacteria bacterium]
MGLVKNFTLASIFITPLITYGCGSKQGLQESIQGPATAQSDFANSQIDSNITVNADETLLAFSTTERIYTHTQAGGYSLVEQKNPKLHLSLRCFGQN